MFRYFVFFVLICSFLAFTSSAFAQSGSPSVHQATIKKIDDYLEYTKGQKRLLYIYRSTSKASRKKMPDIMDLERVKKGSVIAISVDDDHIKFAQYIKHYMRNAPFNILLLRAKEGAFIKMLKKNYEAKPWAPGAAATGGRKKKSSYPVMIFLDEENKIVNQGSFETEKVAEFLFSITPKVKTKKKATSFWDSLFSFF